MAALGSVGGSEFNAERVIQRRGMEDIHLIFTYIGLIIFPARVVHTLHVSYFMIPRVVIGRGRGC